ncbi:MAG: hypothetical protein IPO63_15845 [Bacteroidetes bacterium]|nr:hypothetical protein [Bacteroidota bacterium]
MKRGFDGNTLLSECGAEIAEFADTVRILVTDNSVWAPVTDSVGCIFNNFSVTLSDSIYCFSVANDGTDLQLWMVVVIISRLQMPMVIAIRVVLKRISY